MLSLSSIRNVARALKRSAQGLLLLVGSVASAATLTTTETFTPADATRGMYMDVGGAWNGSTSVNVGDTFTASLINTGTTAYDLRVEVDLPAGISYIAGSAGASTSGVTAPTSVVGNQAGQTLTISLNSGEFDLTGGGSSIDVDFELIADSTVVAGTYQLTYRYIYGDTEADATPTTLTRQQNVLVQRGASILKLTPSAQTRGIGETAEWEASVTNSGFGGLFDVVIDLSDLFGNSSFTNASAAQTSPATPTATGSSVLILPYLAPDEVFTLDVTAVLSQCSGLGYQVTTTDRTGETDATSVAAVTLDLNLPMVDFTAPTIQLDYLVESAAMVEISNSTSAGIADNFTLVSSLQNLPVIISDVSSNFTYDSGTGTFTLVSGPDSGNPDSIPSGESVTLTFTVVAVDSCASSGGSVSWASVYTNECGDLYGIPVRTGTVNDPGSGGSSPQPSVSLSSSSDQARVSIGQAGQFTLNLSASEIASIATDPLVVDFSVNDKGAVVSTTPSVGTVTEVTAGSVYTWSVSKADAGAGATLDIFYEIDMDPCYGGELFTFDASVSGVETVPPASGTPCPVDNSVGTVNTDERVQISNPPTPESDQFFNVTGSNFETGLPSADLVRDAAVGEGEFIPITVQYEFEDGYFGSWTGATYTDDFGGLSGQQIVNGSLTVSWGTGGSLSSGPVAVPTASVTQSTGGLRIDLDFLAGAGFFGSADVSDTMLRFDYMTTVPDSDLNGSASRGVLHTSVLALEFPGGAPPATACVDDLELTFTQLLSYTVERADAFINVSVPSSLGACEPFEAVLTVGNRNDKNISNVIVTLNTSTTDFPYIYTLGQTPVYGGSFAGQMTYSENGGVDPTFTYTGGGDLPSDGTITVQFTQRGGNVVAPVTASVAFDDQQTDSGGSRAFSGDGSGSPSVIQQGKLILNVSPNTQVQINDGSVEWTMTVQNVGSGIAFGAELQNTLPQNLQVNVVDTGAANSESFVASGSPSSVTGQTVTFDLGDLASGEARTIRLLAEVVDGSNCVVPDGANFVTAQWAGCSGDDIQTTMKSGPDVRFASGSLQVVHDTTNSLAKLCGLGEVRIKVKNSGSGLLNTVLIQELMDEATTGLKLVSGTVSYATENAPSSFISVGDPSGDGSGGNPYVFTISSTGLIPIEELVSVFDDDESSVNQVTIRFNIETTNAGVLAGLEMSPNLQASGRADLFCGEFVDSPGVPFLIPTEQPDLVGSLLVENSTLTTGQLMRAPGAAGQNIEWSFTVTNNGNAVAEFVRIRVPLTASGGSATISGDVLSPGAYTGGWVGMSNINPGSSATIVVTETLGSTCVNTYNNAEVTWGCSDPGVGAPSEIPEKTATIDTTDVVMDPDFLMGSGTFSHQFDLMNDGRGRVRVTLLNDGAKGAAFSITEALPENVEYDDSIAPIFSSNTSSLTTITVDASDLTKPVFTLTGEVEYTEAFTLEFYVRSVIEDITRATSFPLLSEEEDTSNGLDPAISLGGVATVTLNYENSCGDAVELELNSSVDPRQPDLDINFAASDGSESSSTINRVVTSGLAETFNVWVRNKGESGSVSENHTVTITLGSGWTGASATLGGVAGVASGGGSVFTFSPAAVGTINQNAEKQLVVTATPTGNVGDPLTVKIDVDAEQVLQDGSTVKTNHTIDSRAFRVLGVDVEKAFVTGSSTETLTSDETHLVIGEEAAFDLKVQFFGYSIGSDTVTDLVIRDSLGNQSAADRGLGLVSIDASASEIVPTVTSTPAGLTTADPVASGVVDFNVSTLAAISTVNDNFLATIVTRLLNDTNIAAVNSDGKLVTNNVGLSFNFYDAIYRSNDSDDGFSVGTEKAFLHDQDVVTVQRPELTVEKTVRNVTAAPAGAFADTTTGEATNVFEFKVVLRNNDTSSVKVPLFDLNWIDEINSKLDLLDGSVDANYTPGADTTGNGSVDVVFTGGITTGPGGQVAVNATNLPIGSAGQDFVQLDPGESITVHYFARAIVGVSPGEVIADSVTAMGDTLPGASGNQTGTTGATGDEDGALELSATDSASITIYGVSQSKQIINTSVGADSSSTVLIGEQIDFEISIVLPQSTASDLTIIDTLTEEFQLIAIGSVTLGSSVVPANATPVTSPTSAALPVNGGALDFTWEFGDTVVAAGTDAQRSITVRYTTQIRNLDPVSLKLGDTFNNSASYTFTGSPSDIVDVTLTTAESDLVITKTATPDEDIDAGDEVTYTVTLDNATGTASAYDVNIVDTLPVGLTYKANSTTVLSGSGESSGLTGTLLEPDLNLTEVKWGREQGSSVNLDIAAGGKLVFTYIAIVENSVEADQELTNAVAVDWTSLDGDPGPNLGVAVGTSGDENGERTYSGSASDTVTIAKTTTQTTKTASGDTLPLDALDNGFRVGDIVTYTIEVDVMEGTHEEFQILDTLPAGMAFVDFQAITPVSGDDEFTFTALVGGSTAPAAAATGNLVFDLGTLVNGGDADTDNDTLTLIYRARILDVAAVTTPDGNGATDDSVQTLSNSVTVRFLEADDEVFITEPTTEDIVVKQPEIIIDKERLSPVATNKLIDGETARFRLTVTNTGDAPAYNVQVLDTIPAAMRTATPQLIAATLAGNDVLGAITPNYTTGTGEWSVSLSNAQLLDVGETLILDYDVVLDDVADGGQTLTNLADVPQYFSKPSDDLVERRAYDNVEPDSEEILTTISVSGTVFEDVSFNRSLDPGENWLGGETVYVNLLLDGSVVDSVEVTPGSGDYLFERVSLGNYTIILTDSPTNTTPVQPSSYLFYDAAPTDGRLNIAANAVDLVDQDFPLILGSFITGVVFQDDGIGSGTANDGIQNGGETGIGQVTVRLTDGGGTVYDTVQTNGEGAFRLFVPVSVADGATLVVEQFNLPSYTSTGGDDGTTGGTYLRSTDTITFTHHPGVVHSDLAFGDIPANSFLTDGTQVIEPGAVAFYSHTFIAGTGGEVSFDIASTQSPALPGWGQTLFLDSNCNGQLDASEARLGLPSAAITVAAGEQICIIVKDASPAGAPFGAQNLNTVSASFTFTNSDPSLPVEVLTRTDTTIIGNPTTSGLELLKAVDKEVASPGETITYTLTFTNNGIGELDDIVIYDITPAYTTFATAAAGSFPDALTAVVITDPGAGNAGGITWTFTGELQPSETGSVSYEVIVDQN